MPTTPISPSEPSPRGPTSEELRRRVLAELEMRQPEQLIRFAPCACGRSPSALEYTCEGCPRLSAEERMLRKFRLVQAGQ